VSSIDRVVQAFLASLVLAMTGCSSVAGTAIRTGPLDLPSYSGAVSIYASGNPPANAQDLGVVEVHAEEQEATVATLLPLFLQKVASLGGDIAVIDGVRARFEMVQRSHTETFYARCGRGPCAGRNVYGTLDEVMVVSIFGRAMTSKVARRDLLPKVPVPPAPQAEPAVPEPKAEPAKPEGEVTP
jgi:hypothetical protein